MQHYLFDKTVEDEFIDEISENIRLLLKFNDGIEVHLKPVKLTKTEEPDQ